MRTRLFLRLLAAFAVVIAIAGVAFYLPLGRAWETSLRDQAENNLAEKTRMFANAVNSDRLHTLQDLVAQEAHAAGARATVIDSGGTVLADSESPPSSAEISLEDPEVAAALKGNVTTDQRPSRALAVPFIYAAAPVSGGVVRLAYPLSDLDVATAPLPRTLVFGSGLALMIAAVFAAIAAQSAVRHAERIVRFANKVAAGDLTARVELGPSDNFAALAMALDEAATHLEKGFAALQASQRQLETLLNSMQDAVIAIGPDDRVQWANRRMQNLRQPRVNAPIVETVRDPEFLRAIRGANHAQRVFTARATSIIPARAFEITAAPLPNGGAVAVLRDLTETERVEKTRRDFIANVSHELRTPLTSIQGYAETLLDGAAENNHSREFLEIIRKNANRMSRLTEDLLTLARVESGEQRFDMQPVVPGELLQEAVENFREQARAAGIELQIEDSAPDPVGADREAVFQVFSNLIGNALKYAGTTSRIVLGARPSSHGVEFYVRDFGPGISSEHLPRLFERFYRVDKARSRESGGTGLGLAIAKHVVLAHGGNIRAESELNHGATFFFTLPLAAKTSVVNS